MRYRAGHRSCAPAREVQENWLHGRRQAAAGRWIHVPILGQQISQRRRVDLPFRARQRGAQETFREGSLSCDGEKANPPAVPSKGCRPTQQYWRLPDFGSGQASQHTQVAPMGAENQEAAPVASHQFGVAALVAEVRAAERHPVHVGRPRPRTAIRVDRRRHRGVPANWYPRVERQPPSHKVHPAVIRERQAQVEVTQEHLRSDAASGFPEDPFTVLVTVVKWPSCMVM